MTDPARTRSAFSTAILNRVPQAEAESPPASTGATLLLQNVALAYGNTRAVDGVSLEIRAGEFFTLLGPSGSGKTSLLHLIAGFKTPTTGDVYLDGEKITGLPPYRREIGVVFQSYALFPHMTVFENVAFPLRIRKLPKKQIRTRVEEALNLVKLGEHGQRRINQLSGGQQQRIALARAFVFKPRLLLMDEPLGALDAQLRKLMQSEIKRLQEQLDVTVVYVTHDQEEALCMSDRIAIIHLGRTEQVGSPQTIYEEPRTRFVAEFMGDTNLISGHVEQVTDDGFAVIRVGARQFIVRSVDGLMPGMRVASSVRPERVVIEPDSSVPNVVQGVARESFYVGDCTVLVIETDDGLSVAVKELSHIGTQRTPRGKSVALGWHPEHTTTFVQ